MMRGNWDFPGGGPFEQHMSGVGIAGMVLMIILWIAVIAAIVIGIRMLVVHSRRNNCRIADLGLRARRCLPGRPCSRPRASRAVLAGDPRGALRTRRDRPRGIPSAEAGSWADRTGSRSDGRLRARIHGARGDELGTP